MIIFPRSFCLVSWVCLSTITYSKDATLSMPCGLRLGLLLLTPTFSARPATHTRLGWAFRGCSESYRGFPGGANGKEPAYQCRKLKRYWFDPCVGTWPLAPPGKPSIKVSRAGKSSGCSSLSPPHGALPGLLSLPHGALPVLLSPPLAAPPVLRDPGERVWVSQMCSFSLSAEGWVYSAHAE